MKKVIIALLFLWIVCPVGLWAVTDEELVDVGDNAAKTRLDRLERRFSELERDIRSLNEKVRSLDDNVDDIKRRHLR